MVLGTFRIDQQQAVLNNLEYWWTHHPEDGLGISSAEMVISPEDFRKQHGGFDQEAWGFQQNWRIRWKPCWFSWSICTSWTDLFVSLAAKLPHLGTFGADGFSIYVIYCRAISSGMSSPQLVNILGLSKGGIPQFLWLLLITHKILQSSDATNSNCWLMWIIFWFHHNIAITST